jgi:hypothetical protein
LTLLNDFRVPQLFYFWGKEMRNQKMRNQKLKTALLSTVALLAVAVAATSIGPVNADQNNEGKIAGQNNDAKADKDAAVNPNTLKTNIQSSTSSSSSTKMSALCRQRALAARTCSPTEPAASR